MFKLMFFGGFILAVICLILSIILFIKNDVAKLLADVTGLSAKKAVKDTGNEKTSILLGNARKQKMAADKKSVKNTTSKGINLKKITEEPVENIFQSEEDMLVLAGEKANSAAADSKEDTASREILEMLKGGPIRLARTDSTNEVDDILFGKENVVTDVLPKGEKPTDVLRDTATDVLRDKPTDILRDKPTDILKDKPTDILRDSATDVLSEISEKSFENNEEDEDSEAEVEDITDVLTSGEEETEITEVLCTSEEQPEEKETSVLPDDVNEEQPLPDIFDVQETATIVHTKGKI